MNTQKGFASILLILLGIVVIGGGVYFYKETTYTYCWPYCENMTDKDREEIKESIPKDIEENSLTTTEDKKEEEIIPQNKIVIKVPNKNSKIYYDSGIHITWDPRDIPVDFFDIYYYLDSKDTFGGTYSNGGSAVAERNVLNSGHFFSKQGYEGGIMMPYQDAKGMFEFRDENNKSLGFSEKFTVTEPSKDLLEIIWPIDETKYSVGDIVDVMWIETIDQSKYEYGIYMEIIDSSGKVLSNDITGLGIGGPDLVNNFGEYKLNTKGFPKGKYKIHISTYGKGVIDLESYSDGFFSIN